MTLLLKPIYCEDVKLTVRMTKPTLLLTKTRIVVNTEFMHRFMPDENKQYFATIFQNGRLKDDFYISVSDKEVENSYPIHRKVKTTYFGNAQLVNLIKMSCGFTDDSVKFRISDSKEDVKPNDYDVYNIITRVNLLSKKKHVNDKDK